MHAVLLIAKQRDMDPEFNFSVSLELIRCGVALSVTGSVQNNLEQKIFSFRKQE
jgi:hypothetical protein